MSEFLNLSDDLRIVRTKNGYRMEELRVIAKDMRSGWIRVNGVNSYMCRIIVENIRKAKNENSKTNRACIGEYLGDPVSAALDLGRSVDLDD